MEVIDNLIMVVVPGAMEAGLGDVLFWGSLAFALAIAAIFAVPVNRWLIARGKGHAAVHRTGVHGGPPVGLVAVVTVAAFIFGATVLAIELLDDETSSSGHHPGNVSSDRPAQVAWYPFVKQ
jgi:hypothetical protein